MAEGETRRLSRTSGADPGTSEAIGLHVLYDGTRETLEQLSTRTSLYGRHAQFLQLTPDGGVAAPGWFPNGGAGVALGGGAGAIQLAADAPTWDISGLLLVTNTGQIRYVSEYDTGTKTAIPGPIDFSVPPGPGTLYELLVSAQFCRYAQAFAEFEAAAVSCALVSARFRYWDWPFRVPTRAQSTKYAGMAGIRGAYRTPRKPYGASLEFENLDDVDGATETGYHVGALRSEATDGKLGFKIWMPVAPASGRVAWYGCAT